MPTLTRYHIEPGGAFHLGRRGVEQEETGIFISADTLFAAMVAAWVELGFAPETLMQQFEPNSEQDRIDDVPFRLSSAFPRAGEVYFYPALPLNRLQISEAQMNNRLKELKRIKFVSEGIFKKAIAGERLDQWLPPEDEEAVKATDRGVFLQGKSLWLTAEEVTQLPDSIRLVRNGRALRPRPLRALRHVNIWQVGKVPRVTVDRLKNSSSIYYTGRLNYRTGCGFWFGIEWRRPSLALDRPDQPLRQAVEFALEVLSDRGLGAERTVGYGHFTLQTNGSVSFADPAPGQPFVTLSRYHPQPAELPQALQGSQCAYRLTSVGGWLQSEQSAAQRRRRLWMVEEGGIVQAVGPGPWGTITDVRPMYKPPAFPPPPGVETFPHPVWRYGLACPVLFGGAV